MGLNQFVQFDSAGTHAGRGKVRIDSRAAASLQQHGYSSPKHKSRQVSLPDFSNFDQLLAMDRGNFDWLQQHCPQGLHSKLHLLLSFAQGLTTDEVPDPYYGNAAGFNRVVTLCEAGVTGLVSQYIKC
jgi:protein-tyrosine phosphatase